MHVVAPLTIIGLHSDRPRSGKSTVAAAMARARGGRVYSIADGIRQVARAMGFSAAADAIGDAKDLPNLALGGKTPRAVLIEIGEGMARIFGEDIWIKATIARIIDNHPDGGIAVIDDVRRDGEGRAILVQGGDVFTIVRSGAPDGIPDINGWVSAKCHTFSNDASPDCCATAIWECALRRECAA